MKTFLPQLWDGGLGKSPFVSLSGYLVPAVLLFGALDAFTAGRDVLGAGGGTATAGVYTLTDTTGQTSVGSASSANYAVAEGFWPEPGEAPVAGTLNLGAKAGQTTSLPVAKLLLLASDPNGETLSVASASGTTTNGATVTLSGGVLTYTPANGFTGTDAITYILADVGGDTVTGTIVVLVSADTSGGTYNQLNIQTVNGSDVRVSFLGIPGTNYVMEVTHDLTPPVVWTPLLTNAAAANGLLVFTNTPTGGQSFYRTRYAP
ncbi:MAG TPA: cadherin-like domain-containing protein [Candidatus Paceibacterota bacterium]|nr:cadherin-like domain-containing protein [Candidatus Paceibacterota bacterium]